MSWIHHRHEALPLMTTQKPSHRPEWRDLFHNPSMQEEARDLFNQASALALEDLQPVRFRGALAPGDVAVLCVLRNEAARLPLFLRTLPKSRRRAAVDIGYSGGGLLVDSEGYDLEPSHGGWLITGGPRHRVFNQGRADPYKHWISKYPFFRMYEGKAIVALAHGLENARAP